MKFNNDVSTKSFVSSDSHMLNSLLNLTNKRPCIQENKNNNNTTAATQSTETYSNDTRRWRTVKYRKCVRFNLKIFWAWYETPQLFTMSVWRTSNRDISLLRIWPKSEQTNRPTQASSDQHWNCFKGNIGETPERRGGSHMGFPERIDTILNWTELAAEGKLPKHYCGQIPHLPPLYSLQLREHVIVCNYVSMYNYVLMCTCQAIIIWWPFWFMQDFIPSKRKNVHSLFVALVKVTYAKNVHIVLFCPN